MQVERVDLLNVFWEPGVRDIQDKKEARREEKEAFEEAKNEKKNIVITELPYQVNKAKLLQNIVELSEEKEGILSNIAEVRDESDRNGMRAVISIKKEGNVQAIVDSLMKSTDMRCSFAINMVAIAGAKPKTLSLMEIIQYYVEYQREIILRRSKYDLEVAKERSHILEGLLIAIKNIDEVVKIIKKAVSTADAKMKLKDRFILSERQAQAILDMRLARLTALEVEKLQQELRDLRAFIAEMQSILDNPHKVLAIIAKELTEIKEKYNTVRKTEISHDVSNFDIEDLIAREDMVVSMTSQGYIKRMALSEYHTQNRGGYGIATHKSKG